MIPSDMDITVPSLLSSRYYIFWQLTLKARDGGSPSLEADQDVPVTVIVTRNLFAPNFVNDPYERVVSPDVTPTDLLFTVSATDADPSVSYRVWSWL